MSQYYPNIPNPNSLRGQVIIPGAIGHECIFAFNGRRINHLLSFLFSDMVHPKKPMIAPAEKPTTLEKLKVEYAQLDREILRLKALCYKLEEIKEQDTVEMVLARDLNRYAAFEEQYEKDLIKFDG